MRDWEGERKGQASSKPDSPFGLPRYQNTEGLVFRGANFPGVELDKEIHQIGALGVAGAEHLS